MKKTIALCACAALLVTMLSGPAFGVGLPFTDPRAVKSTDGKTYPVDRLARLFETKVNLLLYLLTSYLQSGDVLVADMIRENLKAIQIYVDTMGASVGNDRQKELFAKLLAGSQKLRESVEKNIKSIEDYRTAKRVFDYKSSLLIEWLDSISATVCEVREPSSATDETPAVKTFRRVRLGAPKAVFYTQIASTSPAPEARRKKARELWDATSKQAETFINLASTEVQKQVAPGLSTSVQIVAECARELLVHADELNLAWDQTVSLVESLESLVGASDGDAKPPQSEPKPAPAAGKSTAPATGAPK
ncbi:MAG: hypothetical protein LDL33_06865 [Desulfomonile sp.]|nr:hypothetical protein [Desulfomonile sp.]